MGEENTFAGAGNTFYFCPTEDVGTEREKWNEAKLDSIKVLDAIEIPELNTRKIQEEPWGKQSFTLTAEIKRDDSFDRLMRSIKKHQSGLRHYTLNTMSPAAKRALRKCHLHMKKYMFKKKQHDH